MREDRANSEEHAGLASRIENVDPDVKGLHDEIRALHTEPRAGFKSLSEQIEELKTNASGADETR